MEVHKNQTKEKKKGKHFNWFYKKHYAVLHNKGITRGTARETKTKCAVALTRGEKSNTAKIFFQTSL